MYSITIKALPTVVYILTALNFTTSVLAEDRIFSSPNQFQVCGEDPSFTRPNREQQANKILNTGSRYDYLTNRISNLKTRNKQIISRIPGKLYTADSIIFSSASSGIAYDTKILSGMWKASIQEWKCSEALNGQLADMTEKGSVSQIILFGYKIQSIQKKGSFYLLTTSERTGRGIQVVDIDRRLNGKLKIRTMSGENLELVDSAGGKPDFGTR
jgi:hypothetical protein